MEENKKNTPQDDEKAKVGEKSVFDVLKEQRKQQKHQQMEFESKMAEKIAEEKEKERREYEKKLQNEKIELLRIKQTNAEESDILPINQKDEEIQLTFGKKIVNFFYLNKWWLGLFAMFTVIAGFLIYDYATKKNPDMILLYFEENENMDLLAINDYLATLCEDFNDDGKVLSDVYYIPYTGNDQKDYSSGASTKILAEMQSAEAMIVICNKKSEETINPEYNLVNLESLYPDNPLVEKYGFYLKDSKFAQKIGYAGEINDDLYLGIRKPQELAWASQKEMQEVYDDAIIVLDRMIQDLS
ncbi:MAG: hypothetical protein K2G63_05630 [Oscillospiraceae bacterium]|nr:hypothetical protein [Oscillospiraceae bacterium]